MSSPIPKNPKTSYRKRGRSISLSLTTSIILTVAFVSAISIFIGYIKATQKAKNDLQKNVERNISAIADILKMPLWTYDQETIEDIGILYANNEHVVRLKIVDSLGNTLFKTEHDENVDPVSMTRNVLYEGKVAGSVEIALSPRKYQETIRQLLWSGITTTAINLSVLILLTGFFLRLFLKKPLSILSDIVQSYASGDYETINKSQPYMEFQPIVNVIRSMGIKITMQIEELRQAEKKFRGIFENAVEGIFQLSIDGRIINANPSMARILGYESPEDLIRSVKNVGLGCFESEEDYKFIETILANKAILNAYEVRGIKKDSSMLWVSITMKTVVNEKGLPMYYDGSLMDISDRKEKEEAEKRQKAADAASQAKTLFIARMSHEIRTPLNSLLGMAELLMETRLTKDQTEYIKILQSSGEFLESIINDILDFSKIEAQQLELENIPFDLHKIIKDVTDLIDFRAREKNLKIKYHIDPALNNALDGDPVRLKQILINIVGNAIKFTKEGDVSIHVIKQSNPALNNTHDEVLFKVSDTGIGIPESKQQSIFDSFTQADIFVKRQFGGTGLGLSICKRLVDLMGGELKVTSIEDKGSSFFFSLIFKHATEDSHILPVVNTGLEQTLPKLNILLVDDIAPNRTVIHKYLKNHPVTITDATNGQEAYDSFLTGQYDFILMDVEMPVMSGLDATIKIRLWEKENSIPATPLIILSAHAFGDQRKQCYEAGCNDLLVKPIRKKDLVNAITAIINGKKTGPPKVNKQQLTELDTTHILSDDSEKVAIDIMFEDLLDGFFEYFDESLENIQHAVDEKNFDDLYRLGHGLKGSSRNYEFYRLGDIFFEIEKAATDKNLDAAVFHMKQAKEYLENVNVEFVDKG